MGMDGKSVKTTRITVRCNCPICLMANVFRFAHNGDCARGCGFCSDGVFDEERYKSETILDAEEIE